METKQAKKMGRPRVHAHVMTNAERQQRWRDRVKQAADSLLKTIEKNNEK